MILSEKTDRILFFAKFDRKIGQKFSDFNDNGIQKRNLLDWLLS